MRFIEQADEFLIDRVFQRICDAGPRECTCFDWARLSVAGWLALTSVGGLLGLLGGSIANGLTVVASIVFALFSLQIIKTFQKMVRPGAQNPGRNTLFFGRMIMMTVGILVPSFNFGFNFFGMEVGVANLVISIGQAMAIPVFYFASCDCQPGKPQERKANVPAGKAVHSAG